MLIRQQVFTKNDANGNSRAIVMVYQIEDGAATLVYAAKGSQGETQGGDSFKRKSVPLPTIEVSPKEFRRLCDYARGRRVFEQL